MNEKLASIFVPVEVAKLAKEKGFNEWCACLHSNLAGFSCYMPNDLPENDYDFEFISDVVHLPIPTHYQLINWLSEKGVNVMMSQSGEFIIDEGYGCESKKDGSIYFEINEALIVALNLIEVKP